MCTLACIPDHAVKDRPAPGNDWHRGQVMPIVRADLDPNGTAKRRLKPTAIRTARVEQAPVLVTDIDKGEPPHLALVGLVGLVAVSKPAGRTPATLRSKNTPAPHAQELEKGDVRQAIQVRMTSQPLNSRSDIRATSTDIETTRSGSNGARSRRPGSSTRVLERTPNEHERGNGDPGTHAGRVPGEALKLPREALHARIVDR